MKKTTTKNGAYRAVRKTDTRYTIVDPAGKAVVVYTGPEAQFSAETGAEILNDPKQRDAYLAAL